VSQSSATAGSVDAGSYALGFLAAVAAAALAAPALALGIPAAELLRRRRLRWTWAAFACVPGVVLAPLTVVPLTEAVSAAADAIAATHPDPAGYAAAAWLPWLYLTPFVTLAWMLHGARHDRLHGGHAEQEAQCAAGPLDALRTRRRTAREREAGPLTHEGVLLGADPRGEPVRIPQLQAHATIVGGSNSGKTNTAEVLLEAQVLTGGGFVVLDGKGGRDLPYLAIRLAEKHGRTPVLWSIRPYGDPDLDEHRRPWNPLGDGDPTEVKDRIATSEEQTEPYYAAVAARGLLAAARSLELAHEPQRLDALATALESPQTLAAKLEDTHASESDWLKTLNESERSAVRGMATRLRTMVASDGATQLLPADDPSRELRLHEAVANNELVVFTLPQGLYPDLVPHVTRYALQTLNAVCTRVEQSGTKANAMVFVDELSAFDGDQLCAGFERGRSAGVRYIVATQSLSNLATAGGDKLLHAALDNAELLVIHRQAVPDAAEALASIGGTEEAWEHTHQVADGIGYRIGWDETGVRSRRLTDRFRAHPNVIKSLGQGEAIVVSQRPEFAVRRLRIQPGPSTRAR
jgi:hypothetical protein